MNIAVCDENRVIKNVIVLDRVPEPVDDDFFAVNYDVAVFFHGAVFVKNRFRAGDDVAVCVVALSGVILQQVSKHSRASQIVDSNDFVTVCAEHLPECQTADTTETIDSYSYIFCHNIYSSEKNIFLFSY